MSDGPIRRAIRLRDDLLSVAKDIGFRRPKNETEKELNAIDQKACLDAAEMLQTFGTEVSRLRLAIGHYRFGRLSDHELGRISETWNGEAASRQHEESER